MIAIFGALFFGFVPMFFFAFTIYWMDRYEKEPVLLLSVVFLWGVIIAAGGAFVINTMAGMGVYAFTNSDLATELATGSVIAPFVEESLKGLAVLIVFLIFRREFDSVFDGIIYAAVVALGFAATENSYYIFSGYSESGWGGFWVLVFIRVVLVGLQHPFYTAFTGIGLAVARLNPKIGIKLIAPIIGIGVAIFTHSFHNTAVQVLGGLGIAGLAISTLFDWSGWFALFIFIMWTLWYEKQYLKKHLVEEVTLGTLSPAQYNTAISSRKQTLASAGALFNGNFMATIRFYQYCGELAHKKEQLKNMGDEHGNTAIIQSLREKLARLSSHARV